MKNFHIICRKIQKYLKLIAKKKIPKLEANLTFGMDQGVDTLNVYVYILMVTRFVIIRMSAIMRPMRSTIIIAARLLGIIAINC